MAENSKIEWTDSTWNVITGCSPVSPGCQNCYAMRLAGTRLRHHPSRSGLTKMVGERPVWTGEVRFNKQWLLDPIHWKRGRKIFVCAHGDLFHEKVLDSWLDKIFSVMALCPQHVFQVLTKRPERMLEYLSRKDTDEAVGWAETIIYEEVGKLPAGVYHGPGHRRLPLPNVWLGVTAENQEMADERIPLLLQTPAALRFVSLEPLIEPVDLGKWLLPLERRSEYNIIGYPQLDWVICGGESGPHARPIHPDWVRSILDQCKAAGVPFMFKQWGEWLPGKKDEWGNVEFCDQNFIPHNDWTKMQTKCFCVEEGYIAFRFGKKAAGRMLDGKEHMEFPV